jgi:hypothetical protein
MLSGGYFVNVMQVETPLALGEGEPEDSLGTRTYSVQPRYELQFSNPLDWGYYRPPGSVVWEFLPGDSVPATGPWNGPRWYLYECEYQTTCRWAPPRSGRMEATTYVETHAVTVRSANVCEPPAEWDGEDDLEENTEESCGPLSRRCPKILGKVVTAGITVAGRLHTFKFEGPFTRIGLRSVPGTYPIKPTVSEDGWWIVESGTITVDCWGFYIPIPGRNANLFIGQASYRTGDLHMVMGPSHPDF